MWTGTARTQVSMRAIAGAATIAGIGLCYALTTLWPQRTGSPTAFFLVVGICAALALSIRGLGGWMGTTFGVAVGVAASLALVRFSAAPALSQAAFACVATAIMGLLGYVAGCWEWESRPPHHRLETGATDLGEHRLKTGATDTGGADRVLSAEGTLHAIMGDFFDWLAGADVREEETGPPPVTNRCHTEGTGPPPVTNRCHTVEFNPTAWPAFDQFVRQTMRERLGATGVRVFRVLADGEHLEPLAQHAEPSCDGPAVRDGLIGHVLTSGQVYVAGRPGQGQLIGTLAAASPTSWAWLLPLRPTGQGRGLVTVPRLDARWHAAGTMAEAVRSLLQLFWAYAQGWQALDRSQHTDRQSGMLNRTALLTALRAAANASARDDEPIMVLALGLEGLRRLDDTGQWSQRDTLIERLGRVLLSRVRSDDLLGRFSDDRFVVVLRRLDCALGRLIAEKLMEAVRRDVFATVPGEPAGAEHAPRTTWRLRAGLAGSGLRPADGKVLLERALALLDFARSQGLDIATDMTKGLPDELARGRPEETASARPLSAQSCAQVALPVTPPRDRREQLWHRFSTGEQRPPRSAE